MLFGNAQVTGGGLLVRFVTSFATNGADIENFARLIQNC
jgi:threonine aldolase